jgi:3-phenylpropionate/trans-cinnamate dioxygenase ferredoxin component
LLCLDEGQVYAVENRCSHLEEPLACGRVKWGWIACPAHGTRFDLATGEPMNPPATEPIRTFPVRVVGEMIEVAV